MRTGHLANADSAAKAKSDRSETKIDTIMHQGKRPEELRYGSIRSKSAILDHVDSLDFHALPVLPLTGEPPTMPRHRVLKVAEISEMNAVIVPRRKLCLCFNDVDVGTQLREGQLQWDKLAGCVECPCRPIAISMAPRLISPSTPSVFSARDN